MATKIFRQKVYRDTDGVKRIYEERVSQDEPQLTVPQPQRVEYVDRPVSTSRYSGVGILYLLLDIAEILLAFRLIFRLLAAYPFNQFVNFIYNVTQPMVAPFSGIFPATVSQGTVIEWSTILAMVVYALIVYLIVRLVESAATPTARYN